MIRGESFGGASQLTTKSSFYQNDGLEGNDATFNHQEEGNPFVLYLKAKGKLNVNVKTVQEGGKVLTVWNYPTRNKLWPISFVDFHNQSGSFALADARGQVYYMNMKEREYESVKLASKAVSAIAFLQGFKHVLIVAYENGTIVAMNTKTKEILANIQLPMTKSAVKFIRSHPKKPILIFVTEDNTLYLWNLGLSKCTQTLECHEGIVDIRFELNGGIIAVILEKSGIYFYSSSTLQLLAELNNQSTDFAQTLFWTSYVSILHRKYLEEEDRYLVSLNILLSGTDNRLYSYYVGVEEIEIEEENNNPNNNSNIRGSQGNLKAMTPTTPMNHNNSFASPNKPFMTESSATSTTTSYVLTTCYFGCFELPGKFQSIVASCYLGELSRCPIVAVLSSVGEIIILKSEGFHDASPGFLTIIANIPANISQVDLPSNMKDIEILSKYQNSQYYPIQPAMGKFCNSNDFLVVIGDDGAARLFYINEMFGSGILSGTPKILKAKVSTKAINYFHEKQQLKEKEKDGFVDYYEYYLPDDKKAAAEEEQNHRALLTSSGSFRTTKKSEALQQRKLEMKKVHEEKKTKGQKLQEKYDQVLSFAQESEKQSKNQHLSSKRKNRSVSPSKRHVSGATSTFTSSSSASRRTIPSSGVIFSKIKKANSSAIEENLANKREKVHSFVTGNKGKAGTITARSTAALKGQEEVTSMPLFELATLTPKEKRVNYLKLQAFLAKNDIYPSRYRPLIWRFLLKLPENSAAFSNLVQRGIHPAYEELYETYPIPSRKIFQRLQNICSQLTHWSPILGDAPYLPSLVFPFVLVYGHDELAALETVLTIMMYWGYSWHVTHPNPPMHFIDTWNNLIKLHDLTLYQHFQKLSLIPGLYCWSLLSTLFTEICNRNCWLQLMDFLFTNFQNICYFLLVPIAIMKDIKSILLSSDSMNKIATIFHNQQVLNMNSIIVTIKDLFKVTPEKYFISVTTKYLNDKSYQLNQKKEVINDFMIDEVDEAKGNMALSNGVPKFPLPKGNYPVYDGYPENIVNLQIQERNKITLLSKEIRSRENILKQLTTRIEELEKSHEMWIQKHKTSTQLEIKYQKSLMEKEKSYLQDLLNIEEEISSTKIKTLNLLEEQMNKELDVMNETYEMNEKFLIENEKLMKEKLDMNLNLTKQRELADKIEFSTMEKLRQMRMKRTREDWLKNVSNLLKNKEQEILTEDLLLQDKWLKQSDELKFLKEKKEKEFLENEELEKFQLIHDEINRRMQTLQLDRQSKLQEIERQRAIRLAKEQADDALENAEKTALLLKKQELIQQSLQKVNGGAGGGGRGGNGYNIENQLQDTIALISKENENLYNLEKIHSLKNSELKQKYVAANVQQEFSKKMLSKEFQQQQEEDENVTRILNRQANTIQKIGYQSLGKGNLNNNNNLNENIPTWQARPSQIPAPSTGAGIGYGYAANQQTAEEEEQEQSSRRSKGSSSSSKAPQFKAPPAAEQTQSQSQRLSEQQQPQQQQRPQQSSRPASAPAGGNRRAPHFLRAESEEESVHDFSVTQDLLNAADNPRYQAAAAHELRLPIEEAVDIASKRLLKNETNDILENNYKATLKSHHPPVFMNNNDDDHDYDGRPELDEKLYNLQLLDPPKIPPTWTNPTANNNNNNNSNLASNSNALGMNMVNLNNPLPPGGLEDSNSPMKLLYPRKSPSFTGSAGAAGMGLNKTLSRSSSAYQQQLAPSASFRGNKSPQAQQQQATTSSASASSSMKKKATTITTTTTTTTSSSLLSQKNQKNQNKWMLDMNDEDDDDDDSEKEELHVIPAKSPALPAPQPPAAAATAENLSDDIEHYDLPSEEVAGVEDSQEDAPPPQHFLVEDVNENDDHDEDEDDEDPVIGFNVNRAAGGGGGGGQQSASLNTSAILEEGEEFSVDSDTALWAFRE